MSRRKNSPPGRVREVLEELLWEAVVEAEVHRLGRLTRAQMRELRDRCRFTDEDATQIEASEPDAPSEWPLADDLDGTLEGSWVTRIADMRPVEIKELAAEASLTDEQAEAILWCAKTRVDPLGAIDSRPPRGVRAIR